MAQMPPTDPYDPARETLLFLHLPKTAGVSLSLMITPRYREDAIYHVLQDEKGRSPRFSKHHGPLPTFTALPEEVRARYRLILGHMPFGLHEQLHGPASYLTVLRDPVERVLSHYGQFKRKLGLDHPDSPPSLSLEEFFRLRAVDACNLQTQMLCGGNFAAHPPRESLARAKENLRQWFRVVGTTERLDETIVVLEQGFGWPSLPCIHQNIGTHRPRTEEMSKEALARIEEQNQLDRELYTYADSLLTARVEALGPVWCAQLVQARQQRGEQQARRERVRAFCRRMMPPRVRGMVQAVGRGLGLLKGSCREEAA